MTLKKKKHEGAEILKSKQTRVQTDCRQRK